METNLRRLFFAATAGYPTMKKGGGGKIIGIGPMTSILGIGASIPVEGGYASQD